MALNRLQILRIVCPEDGVGPVHVVSDFNCERKSSRRLSQTIADIRYWSLHTANQISPSLSTQAPTPSHSQYHRAPNLRHHSRLQTTVSYIRTFCTGLPQSLVGIIRLLRLFKRLLHVHFCSCVSRASNAPPIMRSTVYRWNRIGDVDESIVEVHRKMISVCRVESEKFGREIEKVPYLEVCKMEIKIVVKDWWPLFDRKIVRKDGGPVLLNLEPHLPSYANRWNSNDELLLTFEKQDAFFKSLIREVIGTSKAKNPTKLCYYIASMAVNPDD